MKHRTALSAVLLLSGFLVFACGYEPGEVRVEHEVRALGFGGSEPFENVPPTGIDAWTIVLDEAFVALGPVYLFAGEPLLGSLLQRIFLPRAHAHPGHYQEGEAMGEVLQQAVVDLLAPQPTHLGTLSAVTGTCHSARVGLGTAEEGLAGADTLRGHALRVAGEATRDEERVEFEAWLDIDLYVEGIGFDHEIGEEPGHLLVEVDLTRWLRRVDFATATPGESEPSTFDEDSQAHNALSRGVDNTLAYRLRWQADQWTKGR